MRRFVLALAVLFFALAPAFGVTYSERENRIFVSSVGHPAFGVTYTVTAYPVGAQVAAVSSGTTITVRAGHGFVGGEHLIVGTDTTRFRTVSSVTPTSIVVSSAVSVSNGEFLVNLGADTGSTGPNYDGSPITTYSDMDGTTALTHATVSTSSDGTYRYWIASNTNVWELVRSSTGTPVQLLTASIAPVRPAGSANDVQVNAGGTFTTAPGFTADTATGTVTMKGIALYNAGASPTSQTATLDTTNVVNWTAPAQWGQSSPDGAKRYRWELSPDFSTWTSSVSSGWAQSTFTGAAAASKSIDGWFFKLRSGTAATDGQNFNQGIALGGYFEWRSAQIPTGPFYGFEAAASLSSSATVPTAVGLVSSAATWTGVSGTESGAGTITTATGIFGQAKVLNGSGSITNGVGVEGDISNAGTGTISFSDSFKATCSNLSTGTLTQCYGLEIGAPTNSGGGTFTRWTGIYLPIGTAATNNRSFFSLANLFLSSGKSLVLNASSSSYDGTAGNHGLSWDPTNSRASFDTNVAASAFIGGACSDTASAATVTADNCNMVTITGSTAITTINTCDAANKGRVLRVLCGSATATITDGSNLKMAGNLVCTADDSLTLACDGTNWIELGRSVN